MKRCRILFPIVIMQSFLRRRFTGKNELDTLTFMTYLFVSIISIFTTIVSHSLTMLLLRLSSSGQKARWRPQQDTIRNMVTDWKTAARAHAYAPTYCGNKHDECIFWLNYNKNKEHEDYERKVKVKTAKDKREANIRRLPTLMALLLRWNCCHLGRVFRQCSKAVMLEDSSEPLNSIDDVRECLQETVALRVDWLRTMLAISTPKCPIDGTTCLSIRCNLA